MNNNRVTSGDIQGILNETIWQYETKFDKCTIVTALLPNGFILVESSACVDPANYDFALGSSICRKRIEDKIWLLEGYKKQCEVFEGRGAE